MHYLCFDCAVSIAEEHHDAPTDVPALQEGLCPHCGSGGPDEGDLL